MKKEKVNKVFSLILTLLAYTVVFIIVSFIFKDFYVDTNHYCIYSFVTVVIIYLLNISVKPILNKLTMPITAYTFGLFYLVLNMFVLKLADWIMMGHFNIKGWLTTFIVASLISLMNVLINRFIVKPVVKKVEKL